VAAVVTNATPILHRIWDGLDNYDEGSVETLTLAVEAPLQAVKTASVRQAVGYYTVLSGAPPQAVTVAEVGAAANMRDPFISVWQALASGNSYEDALFAGRARIEAVVSNLANSSARQTGDLFVRKARLKVHGFERIPNIGACPWCQSVAGRIYKSADAADFGHDRCSCTAAPIFE
jgi:hypothetical protein